jgi:hypothetical protein
MPAAPGAHAGRKRPRRRTAAPPEGRPVTGLLVVAGFALGLIGLGCCVGLGWCADTRDPEFSAGRALAPRSRQR